MSVPVSDLGWPTRIFLGVLGVVMGVLAITFPLANVLHGFGVLTNAPAWGLTGGVILMVFCAAAAVEFFTGHGTKYFGELVRSLADRFSNK